MKQQTKHRKLVMFTSLPHVGGHSTLTLGLCRLFSQWFTEIEVWVKVMPEYGHSLEMQRALEAQGYKVVLLSNTNGRLDMLGLGRALGRAWLHPPDTLFVLSMRHISKFLRLALPFSKAVYFNIAHDLRTEIRQTLKTIERLFDRLVFICPATFDEYGSSSGKCSWAPQSSEIRDIDLVSLPQGKTKRRSESGRVSFGLLGRLTREKGAEKILQFIRNSRASCDFHVAGNGPFATEFEVLSENRSANGPRVFFHGSYSPANRMSFLHEFFANIDWLVVPSIDEWETLSMVTLESLQHGTPVLCSKAGGLRSFGMPALGPAPLGVISLFDPADIDEELLRIVATDPYDIAVRFGQCREHYAAHFSDQKVFVLWEQLVG